MLLNSIKIVSNVLLTAIKNIEHKNLDWAEFGVYKGVSAKYLLRYLKNNLYLFDSFEGLPEDWKFKDGRIWNDRKKGYFNLKNNIPKFNNERAIIKKGWFKETIPQFVKEHKNPLGLIHIDCDIYSSTKDIFDNLNPLIIPGTIIVFDEYYNYDNENQGWKEQEYKAFQEFVKKYNRQYEYIARTSKEQMIIKIIK